MRQRGFPAQSTVCQGIEIGPPDPLLILAQGVEPVPGVEAGVVAVVEADADRVRADRLDARDADMPLAGADRLPLRVVAPHLRRRALDAEQFGGQSKAPTVIEIDLEELFRALHPDLGRPVPITERLVHGRASSPSPTVRASSTNMIGIPSRIGYANPACSLTSSCRSGS